MHALLSLLDIASYVDQLNKKSEMIYGLSLVQWWLVRILVDMPGVSAFELAVAVRVQPSSLTQTLKRLERKKLILIINDPRDSRKKRIYLTRQGKKVLDETNEKLKPLILKISSLNKSRVFMQSGGMGKYPRLI